MLMRHFDGLMLVVLFGPLIGLSTALPASNGSSTRPRDDLTTDFAKQIIRKAKTADIRVMLDARVPPCEDFYRYACGNWHRNNPAQLLGDIMTDIFLHISKGFDRRLQQLLQTEAPDTQAGKRLQSFYQSCKLVHRDDVHYKLALENLYKEFGELPALAGDKWNASEFNWWRTIARIQHKYGKQIIMSVDIMQDVTNNTLNKVYVGPSEYTKSSNSIILKTLEEASTAKDLESYFGLDAKLAKKTAKELHVLETTLMNGGSSNMRDDTFQDLLKLRNVTELEAEYAEHINFTEFLSIVLGGNLPEQIYTYDQSYLDDTFETVQRTPPETLANYILWQLLQAYLADVSDNDISKWCIEQTKKYFGKFVDHAVYQMYRSDATEAEVYSVWEEIRATFRQQLAGDKLDWIANGTRTKAIEKLEQMKLSINSYDNENFEQMYGEIEMDRLNYVANVQQLLMAESKRKLQQLQSVPAMVDATNILSYTPAYNVLENNIKIPVGLLQPRYFWDINYPQAMKYATLGYLIAHEMIHGFDDDGRNYDHHGNYAPWWDSKSRYEFEERRKCFQAQYHEYRYGGTNLPESTMQAENIADNAGVKLAYGAYQHWLDKQLEKQPLIEQQETLSGLELNNRQLFFVSFAQLWCDDVQTLFKSSVASEDVHAPGMYRVIGSLSNFQEFSWVFNCRQDAPMDPEYKCSIY